MTPSHHKLSIVYLLCRRANNREDDGDAVDVIDRTERRRRIDRNRRRTRKAIERKAENGETARI